MTWQTFSVASSMILASAFASGCGQSWPSESSHGPSALSEQGGPAALGPAALPETGHDAPAQPAQALFTSRCAVCHGAIGAGDGPAAVALNPKPRAFADAAWQKSATDALISKTILEGGPAVGKSAGMPPNPDLVGKPDVVKELVGIVRSFKKG